MLRSFPQPYLRINSSWTIDVNLSHKYIKLIEGEEVGENLGQLSMEDVSAIGPHQAVVISPRNRLFLSHLKVTQTFRTSHRIYSPVILQSLYTQQPTGYHIQICQK